MPNSKKAMTLTLEAMTKTLELVTMTKRSPTRGKGRMTRVEEVVAVRKKEAYSENLTNHI